jgi:3-oxosteroid 1-dehydrogenase
VFYMSEQQYDIVVVGSGGGGMTAALTAADRGLSVVIVEKAAHYGGSTARSGGGVWIPNNPALKKDGVKDTPEAARTYLHSIIGEHAPADLIDTFLEQGPKMLDFVLDKTPLKLTWVPNYSDYYPEAPGGRVGGRSVEPKPFNGKVLGAELRNLEPPYGKTPMNVVVTQADYRWLNLRKQTYKGWLRGMRIGARLFYGRLTNKALLGMGRALIAGLRKGLLDANVPILLNTPMTDLFTEDGVVRGVNVLRDGKPELIRARYGVVLAAGGFEHNDEMRKKYQRAPIGTEWTVGAAANTGDGIAAGQKLGGAVALMDDAWWGPTIPLPNGPWFCLAERSLPGGIMVNLRGKRFMNEALPYVEAVHWMYGGEYGIGEGPGENVPAWMIMDQGYRDRYMFAGLQPEQRFPKKWLESGVVVSAPTIAELAEKTGLPADELAATISRFNGFAETGKDEDFGRGDSGYDNYYGDPWNKPNPNLAALVKAPYYAIKMVPGDLGTKGGLKTNSVAQVLREDDSIIEGLYAVGNSSIPVMGHTYAGPGATIGPAMTFGYLAAHHIADHKGATSVAAGK